MQGRYLKWRRVDGCSNWNQILDSSGCKADSEKVEASGDSGGARWRIERRKAENKVEIEVERKRNPGGPGWLVDYFPNTEGQTEWDKVEHWSWNCSGHREENLEDTTQLRVHETMKSVVPCTKRWKVWPLANLAPIWRYIISMLFCEAPKRRITILGHVY